MGWEGIPEVCGGVELAGEGGEVGYSQGVGDGRADGGVGREAFEGGWVGRYWAGEVLGVFVQVQDRYGLCCGEVIPYEDERAEGIVDEVLGEFVEGFDLCRDRLHVVHGDSAPEVALLECDKVESGHYPEIVRTSFQRCEEVWVRRVVGLDDLATS